MALVTQDGVTGRRCGRRSDGACPRPSRLGRGCARASAAQVRATVHPHRDGASAPLRSAARAPGRVTAQRWHAPAPGALASGTCRPCQGRRVPPCSWRPALGGRRERGGRAPSWQGRAVRGGSPRTGVSLEARCARPREPVRARGARYALRAGDVRTGRLVAAQNGRAARPPTTSAAARRTAADRMRKRMSEGLVRTVGSFVGVVVLGVWSGSGGRAWPGSRWAAERQAADVYQVPDTHQVPDTW